jgi:purine-cytosine permease-like protein
MSEAGRSRLVERLDAMYEFDREPVTEAKLHGFRSFVGMYAGEHVAGTEFVIGPLFVVHGVTASDLFLGLILGNLLAVLSWTFVCAPLAVRTRLTLYWLLRQTCGPYLTYLYSVVNALMFCFLAGAMISVAATAIGLPFDMPMPELADRYPTSVTWVVVVFLVGTVVTMLAILGFEKISKFARICAPWMFLVFVAAAVAVLPQLGCNSFGEFWRVANEKIWTGVVAPGQSKFTFWHVLFFAWFCNLAMHIGLSDLTIFRYARKWQYGLASAPGMYLGHFVAWIASGVLCAAAAGTVAPGPIAYLGAGVAGVVCVVVASWTTANPTLYRAGLAFQVATPNWRRWKVTLATGLATTVAALFPALVMKLLDFVALYGLLLMPMGAVIFADYWIMPRLGLQSRWAERQRVLFSWPAFLAWVGAVGFSFLLPLEIFFKALPAWFATVLLYLTFSWIQQRSWAGSRETGA